mmetsp:Transcript_2547/g.9780  ORF Transcript_2547/g.9780 Transcript_2547/m.9780 type:complete len:217 (+) Transcript_2547:1352-2002(+)
MLRSFGVRQPNGVVVDRTWASSSSKALPTTPWTTTRTCRLQCRTPLQPKLPRTTSTSCSRRTRARIVCFEVFLKRLRYSVWRILLRDSHRKHTLQEREAPPKAPPGRLTMMTRRHRRRGRGACTLCRPRRSGAACGSRPTRGTTCRSGSPRRRRARARGCGPSRCPARRPGRSGTRRRSASRRCGRRTPSRRRARNVARPPRLRRRLRRCGAIHVC